MKIWRIMICLFFKIEKLEMSFFFFRIFKYIKKNIQ